jgi:predicted permease
VTHGFFDVLRVRPILGRSIEPRDETAGAHRVAVLSNGLWRRHFGGDRNVVGRRIPLTDLEDGPGAGAGSRYEVIGVMPPDFSYPPASRSADIWVPYVVPPDQRTRRLDSRTNYLQVVARLERGVSLQQARAQMDQVAAALEQANPVWNKDDRIGVRRLNDHLVGTRTRSWMLMLLGAVGTVLLIACANVANLLLARASTRQREVGIRAALGARRWRLIRQLLIESLVLSAAGTVCAIVVAWWGVDLLRASMPEGVPRVATIGIDLRVLTAAAGLSLLTGILFGIVPALQLSRPDLTVALKAGAQSTARPVSRHLRSALVVAEVALAVTLLVGAALFLGSFLALVRIDPGFDASHVLTIQISPRVPDRTVRRDAGPAFAELLERIGRIPGVEVAAASSGLPLSGGISASSVTIPGRVDLPPSEMIGIARVTPDYYKAMGIPLRRGRSFTSADRRGAPDVVIISESAARKYFPGQDPIGRAIGLGGDQTVVGVVGDVHQFSLEVEPMTQAYVPASQSSMPGALLAIRTHGDPYDVLPSVKSAVFAVFPDVPLRNVTTMEELWGRRVAQRRLTMLLVGLLGLVGLAIAAVGVYGVMAYVVGQRTREIGVRMALGATRLKVAGLVLRNTAALVGIGLICGTAAALYASAATKAFLFRVEPTDPRAFAAAIVALTVAALIASLVPARRAARVDPIIALRTE